MEQFEFLEIFKDLDEVAVEFIILTMRNHPEKEIRDHGLFLHFLLSPLTEKTTGKSWPDDATKTVGSGYLPAWLNLTQKRYEFEQGNYFVATEIKSQCDQLGLWAPPEILDWMSSNPKRVISKSEKRTRKKQLDKRNWRAEQQRLIAVFEIPPAKALGWIQQRLEFDGVVNEKGKPFTDETIKSYIEHEADQIESDSYVLAAAKNCDLTAEERRQQQEILIERYPDEVKYEWNGIRKGNCIK